MVKHTRMALEDAGYQIGNAEDFLDLGEDERRLLELKLAIGRTIRERREKQHLTQHQLAALLQSSQSRVAKMEAADAGVSLDLMFRGLFALGGELADLAAGIRRTRQDRLRGVPGPRGKREAQRNPRKPAREAANAK